jgi:CRP-like cAMP-binding protein
MNFRLAPGQLDRLAQRFEVIAYPAGTQIFAAGDRAHRWYCVYTGEVVIRYQPHDGGSLDIAHLAIGDAFGWSAALKRTAYASSAWCLTDVQALSIKARDLHKVLTQDSAIATAVLERAARMIPGSRLDGSGR